MAIRFQCSCGREYVAQDEQAGQALTCSVCGKALTVPPAPAAEVANATRPAAPWLNVALGVLGVVIVLLSAMLVYRLLAGSAPPEPEPQDWVAAPPQKAKPEPPSALPPAEPTPVKTVPTVLRGNEGVRYRKDPKTGALELIVDPFPEEGRPAGQKRTPAKRVDTDRTRQ